MSNGLVVNQYGFTLCHPQENCDICVSTSQLFPVLYKLLNTFEPVRQLPDSFVSQKFIASHEAHQYWFLN